MVAQQQETLAHPAAAAHPEAPSTAQLVGVACVVLVLAQAVWRAWMLVPSWFYTDDYRLLSQARAAGLGPDYLITPFDSQFMPLGRLLAWLAATSGDAPWAVVASSVVALQVLASAACAWMLVTLFGARWAVVGLLGLYLTSAVTVPSVMWWAASLNALPLQVVTFAAVAAWVRHLRTGRRRWLVVTGAVLVVGLLSYVKAVLLVPLLVFLLLAWFCEGSPRTRAATAIRGHGLALAALVVPVAAFGAYYLATVPSISRSASPGLAVDLARTMLGESLATGLLGGPWRWDASNPPVGYADPPGWAVALAWVVLLAVVGLLARRRRRTGRAWVLLAGYVLAAYVLLLTTRAPAAGADIGHELRYLADVQGVAVLCLGLALLPVAGAPGSSAARAPRTRRPSRPHPAVVGLVLVVCAGGLLSSARYVAIWHDDNPGDAWAHTAMTGLAPLGPTAVVDAVVPREVVPGFSFPYNTTGRLLPLLVDDVTFPRTAEDLVVLDEDGRPRRAVIDPVVRSRAAPDDGCGYRVEGSASAAIPVEGSAIDYSWWVRIGYLASADDEATLDLGDTEVEVPVRRGLHNVFVEVTSAVPEVRLGGLSAGSSMCVDVVEVGTAVPGGPL